MTCIEIIRALEQNPPEIFVQCQANFKTKENPKQHMKRYVLNLTTGDIFNKRTLDKSEQPNFDFRYRTQRFVKSRGRYDQDAFALQQAHIVDDKLVLATWVFAPDTFLYIPRGYEKTLDLSGQKMGSVHSQDAVSNIDISAPKIVAIIAISKDRSTEEWEDVEHYGYHGEKNSYVSAHLTGSLRTAIHRPVNFDPFDNQVKKIKNLFGVFEEFFGNGCVGLNKYYDFQTVPDIQRFMKEPIVYYGHGKMSAMVDLLSKIQLPDHEIADENNKPVCYADRINDQWAVLRWWRMSPKHGYVECARLYSDKSHIIPCVSDIKGNWICSDQEFDSTMFSAKTILMENTNILDGTMLAYYKDVLSLASNQGQAIYMCALHPEFEKLCKAGLSWLCNDFLDGHNRDLGGRKKTFHEHVDSLVSHVNWNAKSPLQMVGINRHQMRAFREFQTKVVKMRGEGYRNKEIIAVTKNVFCSETLSGIDDRTFDAVFNTFDIHRLRSYCYFDTMRNFFRYYPDSALEMVKNVNAILGDEYQAEYNGEIHSGDNICRLCDDIIRMIRTGHREELIKPRFASIREIFDTHELLVELSNAEALDSKSKENEQYNDGFVCRRDIWKKWQFDEDDTFCVIAPESPVDIAREGLTLKHCVKSYIPSVAKGLTNIMFIRRKSNPEKPFFTVEIDSYDNIRQVHGMCNVNASTVSGLTEFVKVWAEHKNLMYDDFYANRMLMAI